MKSILKAQARPIIIVVLGAFLAGAAQVAYASLPSPTLSVDPSSINQGGSAVLTWDSGPNSNLNSCSATNFDNTYVTPGYWTTEWGCYDWLGCWEIPYWTPPQTVEQPSGSVSVSPANTTTYSYSCNRTESFGISTGMCYGYATDNGWGWGNCWADYPSANALCQQRGYANASTYAAGGPGGRVCGGSQANWSDWRCDSSCSSSCGGRTLTSITCTNPYGAPVSVSATLTVSHLPDLTATMVAP